MSTDKKLTWDEQVGNFAKAVGKNIDDINNALSPLTGTPGDEALEVLSDPASLSDDDLRSALVGPGPNIPLGVFRKHLSILRGPAKEVAVPEFSGSNPSFDLLPSVPDDESFTNALKAGGVLKIGSTSVLSAVKAAIAQKAKLFDFPDIAKKKMEQVAEELEEPAGEEYFKLQKMITTRNYADVLSVLGVEGSFMTESRKKDFFAKLEKNLWNSVREFDALLHQWYEGWVATAANPAAMMSVLLMGKGGASLPPMMQAPETDGIRDEAERVVNTINKVFSGVGIQVSAALAYDATRIKGILENPALPAATGYTTKEQMLKGLGMAVSADYPRLERNLAKYILGIMELPNITAPNQELQYLAALVQLGNTIQWEKLGFASSSNGAMARHL